MELFKSIWSDGVLPVTKFLEQYGFSVPVLLIVIAATWVTKLADKDRRHEQRYVWIPLAYAMVVVVAIDLADKSLSAWSWPLDAIRNGILASGLYNLYAKTLKKRLEAHKKGV